MTHTDPTTPSGPSDPGGASIPEAGSFIQSLYSLRWVLSAAAALGIGLALAIGVGRVGALGASVASFGDTTNGATAAPPPVFDPRMQIWFGATDEAVLSYAEIEDRFVAEDFVMVSFEVSDDPFGVFGDDSLRSIARLTEAFERIPGVRHVRSLTSGPWIRWGEIAAVDGGANADEGLVISDLVEGDPAALTETERIQRMVAVIGAEAAGQKIGDARVRQAIGDAPFTEFIGEPRLVGTIVDGSASTTVIQVQVLRPVADEELTAKAVAQDQKLGSVSPSLYSVQAQRSALRGIEHAIRVELGRSVETPAFLALKDTVAAMDEGDVKADWDRRIADPTRAFIVGPDGESLRKWFDYDPAGPIASDGQPERWVDRADPAALAYAPDDFRPSPQTDAEFHLGGIPIFELNFEQVGMGDAKYMGAMFGIIILLLILVFRSVAGVVAPMSVVFGSVAAMVGIAFSLGFLFNNLTMISPNMLTAVGIADAIHLVASWLVIRRTAPTKRDAIVETMRRNAWPVFLTSVTTAIGFFSLTVSGLTPVRMLGTMAGIGALVALILSLTFVPAILSLIPHRPGKAQRASAAGIFNLERSRRLVAFLVRNQRPILVVTALLAIVASFGVSRVRIDSDFRAMFPEDNPKMVDFAWIEDRLGGVGDLEIVFDGTRREERTNALTNDERLALDALRARKIASEAEEELEPLTAAEQTELKRLAAIDDEWQAARIGVDAEFLGELDRFEQRLRDEMGDPDSALAVVTDLFSPLDVLRKVHQVQNENDAAYYRTPGEADVLDEARQPIVEYDEWAEEWSFTPAQSASSLVAQYYLQYENGAKPGENLATELSQDRTQFRMQGRVLQAPTDVQSAAFRRIDQIAAEEFPMLGARTADATSDSTAEAKAAMTVSGKTLLFARTTRVFAIGFIQSMSIALLLITAIIGVLFRSWRLALTSIVPNLLPILIPLSFFGLAGMSLDGPAILVSSVALGVCVDDTIHVFTKFMRARRRGLDAEESLAHVFEEAGAAVTLTTVVLVIGFATLTLSSFSPNVMMGTLAGVMIALAWFADMLVVPLLLRMIARGEDRRASQSGPAELASSSAEAESLPAAPASAPALT